MLHYTNTNSFTTKALQLVGNRKVFIIIDRSVYNLHKKSLGFLLDHTQVAYTSILESGESTKSFLTLHNLLNQMLFSELHRDDLLVAIGGGVVTDISGLAASLYKRGMSWLALPTTLLAMIDAAIGGKTAVNTDYGKNLIGTFHLPEHILINTDFLQTLPEREWVNGLGEYMKYGFIRRPDLLYKMYQINQGWHDVLLQGMEDCVAIKEELVAIDLEESKERMLLNFGHTLGHCLERHFDYVRFAHGEAVLYGIYWALRLSIDYAGLEGRHLDDYTKWLSLQNWFEPDVLEHKDWFITGLWHDKKIRNNQLQFVLLTDLGKPVIVSLTQDEITKSMEVI